MRITDADGEWEEETQPNGVKTRLLINPTAAWLARRDAETAARPKLEGKDANKRIDNVLNGLKAKGVDLGAL